MSKIRLHGSSSGYTEIAPVAASGNNTVTLPNDGTIISKDANGAVGVTSITVGTGVTIGDGKITCDGSALTSINAANLVGVCTSGLTKTGGFGLLLQVLQTTKTDTASTGSNSYGDLSGMSQEITTTGSNKVLVRIFIQWGAEAGHSVLFRLARTTSGTTTSTLLIGDDASSRSRVTVGGLAANANWEINPSSMEFLDSPGAGTHTYKVQWAVPSGATTVYFNRSHRDNNDAGEARTPSVITVMEIAA